MKPLSADLARRQQQHLVRQRRLSTATAAVDGVINGKPVINFCSNNYLGLADHPEVVKAFQQAASVAGVGAGSAALIGGYHRYHQALEEALAAFCQRPRVLVFNSGYTLNLGVIACLLERHQTVFADRLIHASLLDGIRQSQAKLSRYRHNDLAHLTQLLTTRSCKPFIITDSVFSMDGDCAPIQPLQQLANMHQATLYVDDAHGFGVIGHEGRGVLDECGDLPFVAATLGKSLGVYGAFISSSVENIEYLIQHARSYIYTTALPPAIAAAAHRALEVMQSESWRRHALHENIHYFRVCAAQLLLPIVPSETAIQPLLLGDAKLSIMVSEQLYQRGFYVAAIRPPSVAPDQSRLRITLSATHSKQQIEQLLTAVQTILHHEKATSL